MKERLQKYLARSGVGSRRHCEVMIADRRVRVNGAIVDEPGHQVNPSTDEVSVDGKPVQVERSRYYLLNKPKGFVCSSRPQGNSRSALQLIEAPGGERLFCVGRLDEDSEGALIVTNDGAFCNLISHPRYGVAKTYLVTVKGRPDTEALEKIRRGVWLAEGKTAPSHIHVVKKSRDQSVLRVSLKEGKNRHLRRVFARSGVPVIDILRIEIGSVRLGRMKRGHYRELFPNELKALSDEAQRQKSRGPRPGPGRRNTARHG